MNSSKRKPNTLATGAGETGDRTLNVAQGHRNVEPL
jgi:hypothetical protein